MTAAGTRARVRAELTREIADVARRHLASAGAAALSLRAVARELGMASSAVYRYFPSRDDLLTALIVDAYDALGDAAEARRAPAAARDDLRGRWRAACRAVREWARRAPARVRAGLRLARARLRGPGGHRSAPPARVALVLVPDRWPTASPPAPIDPTARRLRAPTRPSSPASPSSSACPRPDRVGRRPRRPGLDAACSA